MLESVTRRTFLCTTTRNDLGYLRRRNQRDIFSVRGVRARSARTLIISLKDHVITHFVSLHTSRITHVLRIAHRMLRSNTGTECNFFFARRYCKNCKEHFCIDCHWKCHSKGKRRFHEWDRFDVVKQTCDVCKDRTATVMCHACDGAMYCQKCCDMVHSAKNKRKHDRHDF